LDLGRGSCYSWSCKGVATYKNVDMVQKFCSHNTKIIFTTLIMYSRDIKSWVITQLRIDSRLRSSRSLIMMMMMMTVTMVVVMMMMMMMIYVKTKNILRKCPIARQPHVSSSNYVTCQHTLTLRWDLGCRGRDYRHCKLSCCRSSLVLC
jgi:hypothetical protein